MATGAHSEVRVGKGGRSNVEQAVGQSREVRAREPDEAEAKERSTLHRLQGKFPPESRWNSAGCLLKAPAGSGSHLLLMHRFFQLSSDILGFLSFGCSQNSLIKLFCQKLRKVTPFVENGRSKLKDRFFFLNCLERYNISFCTIMKKFKNFHHTSQADSRMSFLENYFTMCQFLHRNTPISSMLLIMVISFLFKTDCIVRVRDFHITLITS